MMQESTLRPEKIYKKKNRGYAPVRINNKVLRLVLYLLMFVVLFAYVIPILWIITTSFKPEIDTLAIPPKILFTPTIENYTKAFATSGLLNNVGNSVYVSIGSSLLAVILGLPAAYSLSRFKFKSKENIYFWFMSTRMAPPFFIALPFFIISRQLMVFDTIGLLITVNMLTLISWVVWMMRSFFDEIPSEIDEAALVDGCNRLTCLTRIITPLTTPGIAATLIFCLIMSWNEYFFSLTLTNVHARTLPAALTTFISTFGLLWGQMCAAATVIMAPILIFVMFLQRYLIRGLTMGAVKG
ncbi:MAG: carbohydrate ABC transporter permease [Oscillospiraceae bacterium]|nr:carbohydrate ABC transporter permease [Oscillospiraceae bacterium]